MIKVSASLESADSFTDEFMPPSNPHLNNVGQFTLSIAGTWEGTLSLQRSLDNGDSWLDTGDEFESNGEYNCNDSAIGVLYRLGFKSGNYTSGTADVTIAK
jgi:hypothetical protein